MRRREFIGLAGGAAVTWPLVARAQQGERPGRMYHVAVLIQGAEQAMGSRLEALRTGLRELGHIEGQNIRLTVRWNEGGLDRLSDLAAELLHDQRISSLALLYLLLLQHTNTHAPYPLSLRTVQARCRQDLPRAMRAQEAT